jgi:hypothetical protein
VTLPVTPALTAVYDELLTRAAAPPLAERADALRKAFFARTQGSVASQTSEPETRVRASWDDALTTGGLAATLEEGLEDAAERSLARAISRAHRSLFRLASDHGKRIAEDLLSGASFVVLPRDDMGRAAFAGEATHEDPLFDARIVAASDGCATLPGIIFHPTDATPHIYKIADAGRARGLSAGQICDALLRMEHTWSTLSRVKVAFAYRLEALDTRAP